MGVTGLWNIVTPLSTVSTLSELRGKVIAIDLSCWIVDSQTVGPADGCPKKYLRNIFFRAVTLLLNGVLPVFVLEGKAPVLKHDVIRQRNNLRKNVKETKSSNAVCKKAGRGKAFNATVKECEMMLEYMGLTSIKAHGEAEAMCAYLNADGLVDGCITQDSDCFLYGAKTIYKNFTLTDKSGFGCAVEKYSLEKIQSVYNFGRNKMIALALLCGCDYDTGVPGIGKDGAMKWLQTVDDDDVLKILQNWSIDKNLNPVIAPSSKAKKQEKLVSNEYQIKKKCMMMENFPNQELIDEFLVRKGEVPNKISKWDKPNVILLIEFLSKKLKWKYDYTIEKVIPILTRWNVENLINVDLLLSIDTSSIIIPKRIAKVRNIQSIGYYEIEWDISVEEMNLVDMINEENECELENPTKNLSTIEPQELVKKAYPGLVERFEKAKAASKKKPMRKRRIRKKDEQKDAKIDQFFKTKRLDVPEILPDIPSLLTSINEKNQIESTNCQLEERVDNHERKNFCEDSLQLDTTIYNIYETLDEKDFETDVEADALEMSLAVARVCESTDVDQIPEKMIFSGLHSPKIDEIVSNHIRPIEVDCKNNDEDEFDDDIPYIPLDIRIKS